MGAPQAQDLAALVGQVVDELAVLAVLAHQRLPQLEHRGVDRHRAVPLEHARDAAVGLADTILRGLPQSCGMCKRGTWL